MPIHPTWADISLRLLFALAVGAIFGLNRSEHGRAAGLRTSILVCLAACIAMLQVNILLSLKGRSTDSFVMNDLMRLPLGILSGIGFIGAGAIVRRDNLVTGVTTAATIWFLTVLGLCFGGGQIALGSAGGAIGLAALVSLKPIEKHLPQDHQATLRVLTKGSEQSDLNVRAVLQAAGYRIASLSYVASAEDREMTCELRWSARAQDNAVPEVIRRLQAADNVTRVEWSPKAPSGI